MSIQAVYNNSEAGEVQRALLKIFGQIVTVDAYLPHPCLYFLYHPAVGKGVSVSQRCR